MPDVLRSMGSIVLLLGGLIFVHELGHFIVAKLLGVKVVRFSIGFGPRLFGFRRGETEYRIAALPLGGYVKMAGDDPTETIAPEDKGRGFLEQPPWKRLVIAFAGPAFNLAFPIAIYLALGIAENGEPTPAPVVGTVTPASPAEQAGLRPGDRILSVAPPGEPARPVRWFTDLRDAVSPYADVPLTVRVQRDGRELPPLTIVPAPRDESNVVETIRRGVIGIAPFYSPAMVAPVVPGAAGPLEPFDVVVKAGSVPVKHLGDLRRAIDAASCGPIDLEVVREAAVPMPGANLANHVTHQLKGVPTCRDGKPAIAPADPNLSTYIASVAPGSPAAVAGLRRGDAIAAVNGKPVRSFLDVNAVGREFQPGKAVALALADGREVRIVPAEETYLDELTQETARRPFLGFKNGEYRLAPLSDLVVESVPLARGVVEIATLAWEELVRAVRLTVLGIAKLFTGEISFKTVGGPIMLFQIASEAAREGLESFLFKMALISVNLGLMNLLPIPVLDGGHIAQSLVESVTRRPLSVRTREIANIVGIILLFTLMIFVFKNDIARLIG